MTETKTTHTVRRGRIFPEIQWTEEQFAKRRTEREDFYQRSKEIFNSVKSEYIDTHYGWYMVVEPDSGDYFVDRDEEAVMQQARVMHPGTVRLFLFRINETGASGTI
jgi:hypothetical protein